MSKIKILVADDHFIVREGLRQLLNSQPDMEVVGEAEDGQEALKLTRSLVPDVVLIDISMPKLTGLEAIRLIKEAVPTCRIVVLSMHTKEAYVHEVLSSGALGYVIKASSGSEVIEAIRAAKRGEYFLSSKIQADVIGTYLKSRQEKPEVRGYDLLSEREQQIFRLVVEGRSNKQIADILFLSPKTVDKHRGNIMRKLGVHDVIEMVKYAIKIGLVDPGSWGD
jgi:two-component system response regulator NreC